MDWILVGYLPKQMLTRNGWVSPYPERPDMAFPAPEEVEEICSVSRCIAQAPEGLFDGKRLNMFGLFDSIELAWELVPESQRSQFAMFAYVVGSTYFELGGETPLEFIEEPDVEPIGPEFQRLGWDAVQCGGNYLGFGCSPLSCNGARLTEVPITLNRFFLMDSAEMATQLAREYSISQPEPGPYGVAEVWRLESSE